MRLGAVKIYTTASNSTIKLSYSNPFVLYNIKILAINPKMNLAITVTNADGDSWSFTVTSGTEVSFKKVNYQSITFKDPNNYTIYYTLQAIYTNCYQELLEFEQESDISIVPINNVIITAPIDINGNVMVTVNKGYIIFSSSQSFTVPQGVYKLNVLAVGGGGGGGGGYSDIYIGGGGGSGGTVYGEIAVTPGQVLQVIVGGGGSGGTGGASTTAGGAGGGSGVNDANGNTLVGVYGGGGGGGATSTANGAGGNGGLVDPKVQSVHTTFLYGVNGNNGSAPGAGSPWVLVPPSIASTTPVGYYTDVGVGGQGGGVNSNGSPGLPGIVIIWWGG